jgi:hypothetical protein
LAAEAKFVPASRQIVAAIKSFFICHLPSIAGNDSPRCMA